MRIPSGSVSGREIGPAGTGRRFKAKCIPSCLVWLLASSVSSLEEASVKKEGIHIQGDHGGQRLGFVDFNFVFPQSPILPGWLQAAKWTERGGIHSSLAPWWRIKSTKRSL